MQHSIAIFLLLLGSSLVGMTGLQFFFPSYKGEASLVVLGAGLVLGVIGGLLFI